MKLNEELHCRPPFECVDIDAFGMWETAITNSMEVSLSGRFIESELLLLSAPLRQRLPSGKP